MADTVGQIGSAQLLLGRAACEQVEDRRWLPNARFSKIGHF